MSDYNYTQQPEPVVTVKKELFSKNGIWLLVVLGVVAIGGAASFYIISTQPLPVPVVEEVVEPPLSEAETEIYRSSLDTVYPEDAKNSSTSEVVVIIDESVVEVPNEDMEAYSQVNNAVVGFVPEATARAVDLSMLESSGVNDMRGTNLLSETAFVQGDVEMTDFIMDVNEETGSPIQLVGAIHANDSKINKIIISSGGELFVLKTENANITTTDGKLIAQSSLKKDDVVTVKGLLTSDGQNIIAQSLVLTGVQEYLMVF
jgi:hypothetical protein